MNPQTTPNLQSRYCIQRIELKSTKKVKNNISAKLLIDGEVVHKLPPIEQGQPLVWNRFLFCNAGPDSTFRLNVHEESYFGLRRTPKCHYEFPASEIQNNRSNQLIERTSKILSAVVSFSNPDAAISTAISAAQSMQAHPAALDRLGQSRPAFEAILDFGTTVSEVIPIATAALSLFQGAWQKLEEQAKCDENIEQLLIGFADILRSVRPVKELAHSEDLRRTITDILRLIQDASQFIIDYKSESEIRRLENALISSPQYKVQKLLSQLKRLKENFDRELSVQEHLDRIDEELSKLKPVARSTFHHSRPCLEGTRTAIISDIDNWIRKDTGSDQLLWVHGLAGLGKSSIATSVCQLLEDRYMLAASFFCKRDDPELREPQRVMGTITYNLARHYTDYRKLVVSAIHNDPRLCDLPVRLLYNDLVKTPLMTLANSGTAPSSKFVVIVDALDECGAKESRRELLSCLVDMSRQVPWLKVIITSRPDQDIQEIFDRASEVHLRRMNVREYDASDDISTFLQEQLGVTSGGDSQFDDGTIRSLKERAAGLFIWAETACRFILDGFDPQERLDEVLKSSDASAVTTQLDVLYSATLINSMKGGTTEDNKKILRRCIGIIVATGSRIPLSVPTLERLLSRDPRAHIRPNVLGRVVKALGSVLYEDSQGAVRVYHPSFADYITTPSRSNDLCIDLAEQNAILSTCCLNTMLKELKFNVCGLETSYRLNKDVPNLESRVSSAIGPHLSYSCRYWISHTVTAEPGLVDVEALRKYLFGQALVYWIEALSLLGTLHSAIIMLPVLAQWKHIPDDCSSCADDAYRFTLSFYEVISQSTPHLYLSAFPFAPTQSGLAQRGIRWFPNTLKLITGAQDSWTACLRIVTHPPGMSCVAFSPNGGYIISSSGDKTVRIWDEATGVEAFPPLQGHTSAVWSVALSSDGQHIISGSSDKTVRIWDAETGTEALPPLQGHSDAVRSVAFSPDGRRIVSGSDDKTVRIWHVETGTEASPPLKGHSGPVYSVAFSRDGRRIASGSEDNTVRIWDAETGTEAFPPLTGHSSTVSSIAFSPNGRRIASGSWDKTVRIWDAETSSEKLATLVGHSSAVSSVVFSPDGRRIVTGSWDNTVRIWDAEKGTEASPPLKGHVGFVISIALSPDGRHIVSGSWDNTIRVWDAETAAKEFQSLNGHSAAVASVAFSPEGRRIVSCSDDTTVRIWDSETGINTCPPLEGHSNDVWSVSFSPDGRRIVSGSADATMRIWDAETGTEACPPLKGHSGPVRSVAFSPNGQHIVSGSWDNTARIWDAETGTKASPPLIGHSDYVQSVSFSPDGRRIVSGSADMTMRIWDAETGTEACPPLKGHSAPVRSVAFSPDGRRIVSGSEDETVRIWDVETGTEVFPPLKSHFDTVCSVAFSRDGRRIASGSWDKTVRIWDAETGAEAFPPLKGHSGAVFSVAFSPDGQHVVSGSIDTTVRTWTVDCSTTQEPPANSAQLLQLMDPDGWVSPDNQPLLLWVPPEYRAAAIDTSLLCISSLPLIHRIAIDPSKFVHGTSWMLVAPP